MNAAPTKSDVRAHCYICGQVADLTADHLPPRGFFPPEDRKNLLMAPLCRACHEPLASIDETIRAWLAAAGGRSHAGKWIWTNG